MIELAQAFRVGRDDGEETSESETAEADRPVELLAAVDLGGTHLRTALVDHHGRLTRRSRVRIRHQEKTSQVVDAIRALITDQAVGSVVVGVPGRVDRRAGRLEQARNLPASWIGELNAQVLSAALGLDVALAGDAELAVLGEAYFGAGTRTGETAYLTLSTGVGAAATSKGRLLAGRRSGFQIGFLRPGWPDGSLLDTLASGQRLDALARSADGAEGSVQWLLKMADAGDARAAEVWDSILRYATWAALVLCHVCNPDILVIGGGLATAGDRLLTPIADAVHAELAEGSGAAVQIRRSVLGDDAALAGAAALTTATAGLPEPDRTWHHIQ